MNRQELVRALATKTEVSMAKADAMLEALTVIVSEEMKVGGYVKVSGFGKWEVIDRKERQGVNPTTGEKITIPANKAVKFKVGKSLKQCAKV